ncbi:MAG: (Fe-S)-binding protein [Candidatus Thermoplasmatota archaeon]|nr:(Fe-S)-binding protein [Candidatus Thermoplasmatota archaeon]
MNHLKEIQHELMCCTGCGYCKKSCPVFDIWGTEADSGKGKVFLSYGLMMGEVKEDISVIEALQKCTLCGRCEKECPSLVKISDIIHSARKDLKGMLPAHEKLLNDIDEQGNPFGKDRMKVFGGGEGEIAYFSGCMANGLKDAVFSVFDKLGINVTTIDEECCGNPIDIIGRENRQIEKLGKKFGERDVKKIVFSCPSCMQSFLPLKEKFELIHISEFLMDKNINLKDFGMKLIYHDSSILGRKLDIYDAPRKLLEKAGSLVEFDENKELSHCCGSDLAFRMAFPLAAGKMAEKIIGEAREKDAVVVTSSPHCYHHLKKHGDVIDIIEVVDRCLQ